MRRTIHDVLAEARARLDRLTPAQARRAVAEEDALIVDIRTELQRERDGVVPGSIHFPRNVLEWRLDPDSGAADPRIGGLARRVVVMCDAGYQSSLAAAGLRDLGFERATDLAGGFQAWRAAGLPVEPAGPTAA
jgi:rhodanese-related sulfurtransferase